MLDSRLLGTCPEYMGSPANKVSSHIDEIDEDILLSSSLSSRSVLVPRIQSMQEYILKHHKRMVLSELNRQIRSGLLNGLSIDCPEFVFLKASNCTFDDMAFWRYNAHTLLVDVIVHVAVSVAGETYAYDLYCELWVDMRRGMSFTCGEAGLLENKPQRNFWMLSTHLVPLLRKDEIEKGAEDLLLQYCPTALTDYKEHNAYLLADKMGLHVEHLPLFHQQGTLSILFFCVGTVQVADDRQKSAYVSKVNIPAGTIVINTNAVHKDCCQMEIYHECIHYAWHYMFFRLQDMHNSDINKLRTKHVVITNGKVPANPLKWMEWQARRGSFGLMMPLELMRSQIEKHLSDLHQRSLHAGQKLDRVARAIARERDLPKFRVRARLIQMGYIAAKGALNFVDGAYIEPFAFSLGNGGGDFSFVIDRKNSFFIYETNDRFREDMESGRYVYADGHIVLNDERYVRRTAKGLRLTPWANAHVDACCLRFIHIYEQCGIADYRFGAINSDEEYNRHYFVFAHSDNTLSDQEKLLAMSRALDALPGSFHDALTHLMKQAHITIEELEEQAFLSRRTISRLRTEERRDYSLDQVIAICVALHLPPWLSREMIQRAGFILRPTKQHLAYQFILDCLFMDSVSDAQKFLAESGCQQLRLSSINS